MEDPRERLTRCISTSELERRWNRVREMMHAYNIDYLVIQNSEEFLGGTVRWFTDFSARFQFPYTVIFPVDDEMTTINCGGDPPADQFPPQWSARGIKNRLGGPYFSTLQYTNTLEAELAVKILKQKKHLTIGLVERAFIPLSFYEYLVKNLPGAKFVDATERIHEMMVIKSPEEIELIKESALIHDQTIEHLKNTIKVGMRDCDVLAEAQYFAIRCGSEQQLIQVGSGPAGTPVSFQFRHFQNRVIKEGDQVSVLIEVNGPGGYYTEIAKCFVVGKKPSQELQEAHGIAMEAQKMNVDRLQPGADSGELFEMTNDFLKRNGYAPNLRPYAHGQGLSLVERPMISKKETWKIKAGMNITVHPKAITKTVWATACENWIIGENGAGTCLHKSPQEIIVIE